MFLRSGLYRPEHHRRGREEEEELEWGQESIPVLRSIVERDEEWFCLPDKFEIHEWEVMRQFAEGRPENVAAELDNAIHGSGAFRRFKNVIHRHGLEDEWFAFKLEALRRKAREALESEGIPVR